MTRSARLGFALVALGTAAVGPGCGSEDVTYTYIRVKVDMDPSTLSEDRRREINSCGIAVTGAVSDAFSLPCTKGLVPYSVGTFRYTTTVPSGDLVFKALMFNIKRAVVAEGETPPVTIDPGMTLSTSLLALGKPAPDAGAGDPDAGDTDGGGDEAAEDAASDTPDAGSD